MSEPCKECGATLQSATVLYFFPNPGVTVDCCPVCGLHEPEALLRAQQQRDAEALKWQNDLWRATEGRLGVMP